MENYYKNDKVQRGLLHKSITNEIFIFLMLLKFPVSNKLQEIFFLLLFWATTELKYWLNTQRTQLGSINPRGGNSYFFDLRKPQTYYLIQLKICRNRNQRSLLDQKQNESCLKKILALPVFIIIFLVNLSINKNTGWLWTFLDYLNLLEKNSKLLIKIWKNLQIKSNFKAKRIEFFLTIFYS